MSRDSCDEIRAVSREATNKILDDGLGHSTWRANNEDAYNALLKYREDIRLQIEGVLLKSKLKLPTRRK